LYDEAHVGLSWLDKMWDESTRTLYLQVGIGSGNDDSTFHGDHDLWRLPQDDDANTRERDQFATAHRPVFRAAAPGARISPNLAGRVAAAFALAAQVDAARDPVKAAAALDAATTLYAQADTANPPRPLVTALPNEFYPEDSWHDDMEFGATEIALASQKLGRDPKPYLAEAAAFARGYITGETGGTFNLYDTSALAHADLIKALRAVGNPAGLPVTPAALLSDLRRQVQSGAVRASADVFHAGADYTTFDVSAHTFGLLATEALYRQASGDATYSAYATQQRNWVLGANAWGTSFMIGEGTTFPRCPQHQVSNLKASVVGTSPVLTGAVVNGPNNASEFDDSLGEFQDDMVKCPGTADPFKTFNGHKSRYVDDVRAWQTNEPALDMTGSAVLGSALQQAAANNAGRGVGDFALKVSTPSASVAPGASTTVAVRAGDESTIGALVALSASGMPTGVTVALAPASVLLGTEARMVVSSDPSTPPGKYEITVTGVAGPKSRTATFTLTIAA
jgi:endoglucanase